MGSTSSLPVGLDGADEVQRLTPGAQRRNRFTLGLSDKASDALSYELGLELFAYDAVSSENRDEERLLPFALRRASVALAGSFGRISAGIREPKWGMGMVAGGRGAYATKTYNFAYRASSDVNLSLAYGAVKGPFSLGHPKCCGMRTLKPVSMSGSWVCLWTRLIRV